MRMIARTLASLVTAVLLAAPALRAQTGEQEEVMRTVRRLFDGMRAGDSAMIRSTFHPAAVLMSVGDRNGTPALSVDSVSRFVRGMATPHPEVYDERISNEKVHVDGNLAVVWTDYAFYRGTTFNHCGVDTFQLFKSADGWKIIALTDTRRREGCAK